MKRTLVLFGVITFVITFLWGTSTESLGKAEKKATCLTTFLVVGSNGEPVADCLVHIAGPCGDICSTDRNGECQISVGDCGTLTVSACCGGQTQFTACKDTYVTINCP